MKIGYKNNIKKMEKLTNSEKKVMFYLKNKKNGKGTIFAIFHFGYQEDGKYRPLTQSTGESISEDAWDLETQRVKKGSVFNWAGINRKLNSIESDIINAYESLIRAGDDISPEAIKTIKKKTPQNKPKPKTTLIGFAENYCKTCGKDWKTIRHYGTTINYLKKYCLSRRTKINFSDVNESFYNDFVRYMESSYLRINTIGGHIKNLKVFLRRSYTEKIHNNEYFKHPDFKVLQEEVDSIYLTKEELIRIYKLNLSGHKTLDETRDGFLLAAFTGLRFSDLENLKPENINEDRTIQTTVIKTKKPVWVPVGDIINNILAKYYPKLPKIISNQKFNNNLKIIAKLAKLNEWVSITRSNGGVHQVKKIHKYWLVSSHTARRSFATNMVLAGVPFGKIKLVTGHKTERAFWKYVKIRPKENAQDLINTPFLNFD